MKNRAYLWLAITTLAAIIMPLDAASGGTPGGSQLSCLDWSTRTSSASTSTTTWKNVPGMGLTVTLAQNFAVQVSGTFSGANVRFRLLDTSVGGSLTLAPGTTSLTPRSGIAEPFSFTWVGTNPAEHQHTFHLQWRRHTSGPGTATMKAGALTALYQGAPTPITC